jgi:hypothetical protein
MSLSPSLSPRPVSRSALLRKCAHAFCMALQSSEFHPEHFIDTFMVPENPRITEHGPAYGKKALPFLATDFTGSEGCMQYFERLSLTLKMRLPDDAFPPDEELVVDPEAMIEGMTLTGAVCVVGKGTFENRESGWSWDEKFIYKLSGFDEDGRVAHWVCCPLGLLLLCCALG